MKRIYKGFISLIVICACLFSLVGCTESKQYKITLDTDGGVCNQTYYEFNVGEVIKELPVPAKDGYFFVHWYVTESKIVLTEGEEFYVRKNVTAVARYRTADEVVINYRLQGGQFENPDGIKYLFNKTNGEDYKVETPIKFGYEFLGWSGFQDGLVKELVIPRGYDKDINIKAEWQEKSYTVNFNLNAYCANADFSANATRIRCTVNGSLSLNSRSVGYSKNMSSIGTPVPYDSLARETFYFKCWFIFKDESLGITKDNIIQITSSTIFNNQTVGENTDITVNVLLTPQWTENM